MNKHITAYQKRKSKMKKFWEEWAIPFAGGFGVVGGLMALVMLLAYLGGYKVF